MEKLYKKLIRVIESSEQSHIEIVTNYIGVAIRRMQKEFYSNDFMDAVTAHDRINHIIKVFYDKFDGVPLSKLTAYGRYGLFRRD